MKESIYIVNFYPLIAEGFFGMAVTRRLRRGVDSQIVRSNHVCFCGVCMFFFFLSVCLYISCRNGPGDEGAGQEREKQEQKHNKRQQKSSSKVKIVLESRYISSRKSNKQVVT